MEGEVGVRPIVSRSHRVRSSICLEGLCKLATARRGGRRLWKWPFVEFCEMLTRAVWAAFNVRRAVPANKPPDDRFKR
jgi:hypothetical protein